MELTILCVDDLEEEHQVYQKELGSDYNLLKAMNSQEAIQHLQSGIGIDAILIDLQLGLCEDGFEDGIGVTQQLRDMGFDLPILVVTRGEADPNLVEDAKKYYGVMDMVKKDPELYKSILTEILQGQGGE